MNVSNLDNRLIDVLWQDKTRNNYLTKIRIYTNSNESNLGDIINKLTSSSIVVNKVVTNIVELKYNYVLTFYIKSEEELENIFKNLMKLSYVVDVERVIK